MSSFCFIEKVTQGLVAAAAHAAGLLLQHVREARNVMNSPHLHDAGWGFANVA